MQQHPIPYRMLRRSLLLTLAFLTACDGAPEPAAPTPTPDAQLGRLYVQTCMACHTSPGSGAPQAGDREAWQPRLRKGMDVLVQNTVEGYEGMPPLGSCMDCTREQFEALIRFMAGA